VGITPGRRRQVTGFRRSGVGLTVVTMMNKLASASVNHRYRTLIVWLAALVGVIVLGGMVHTRADINNRLDGSDSQRAYDLAAAHMPSITGPTTAVVFKTDDLASTAAVIDEIRALPRVDHVDSPIDHPEQVGPGGISFASVSFMRNGPPTIEDTAADHLYNFICLPVARNREGIFGQVVSLDYFADIDGEVRYPRSAARFLVQLPHGEAPAVLLLAGMFAGNTVQPPFDTTGQ